jgi:hypothetical protein
VTGRRIGAVEGWVKDSTRLFVCGAPKSGDIHRYHNSKDRAFAADFKHHAPRCFCEEAVNGVTSVFLVLAARSTHSHAAMGDNRSGARPVPTQALKYG